MKRNHRSIIQILPDHFHNHQGSGPGPGLRLPDPNYTVSTSYSSSDSTQSFFSPASVPSELTLSNSDIEVSVSPSPSLSDVKKDLDSSYNSNSHSISKKFKMEMNPNMDVNTDHNSSNHNHDDNRGGNFIRTNMNMNNMNMNIDTRADTESGTPSTGMYMNGNSAGTYTPQNHHNYHQHQVSHQHQTRTGASPYSNAPTYFHSPPPHPRDNAHASAATYSYSQPIPPHLQSSPGYYHGHRNDHGRGYGYGSPYAHTSTYGNGNGNGFVEENGNANVIIRLIESDMYYEARQRTFTHPHECFPIPMNMTNRNHNTKTTTTKTLYHHTALGIACRKFSSKTCSSELLSVVASPNGRRSNSYNTTNTSQQQMDLIQALYRACPLQIRCSQEKVGRTPLLDCIMNPNCTFELRRFMMDADVHFGECESESDGNYGDENDDDRDERSDRETNMDATNHNSKTKKKNSSMNNAGMAMRQLDSNQLLPLHHLINQVRRNAVIAPDNDSALQSIHYMIHKCPSLFADSNWTVNGNGDDQRYERDSDMDTEPEPEAVTKTPSKSIPSSSTTKSPSPISPLIHLLSQKVGSRHQGNRATFMRHIVSCAHLILEANPNLIRTQSVMSKCTPLHMALRNGYGDYGDVGENDNGTSTSTCMLISLLLKYDPEGYQVNSMNGFGDLPVHVAASVGVKVDTWKVLLDHILNVEAVQSQSHATKHNGDDHDNDLMDPIHGPCSCLWSVNKKGLTPLHLMWMRQVNGEQVKYPNSSRQMGRMERDGYYDEALQTAIQEIRDRKRTMGVTTATAGTETETEAGANRNQVFSEDDVASFPEIAADVLGPFWEKLEVFLQGTQSIISSRAATGHPLHNLYNYDKQEFHFLHAIYALSSPLLPRLFLDLGLEVFPYQVFELDRYGRVPLHYACSSYSVFKGNEYNFQMPEKNDGWKEMDVQNESHLSSQTAVKSTSIVETLIDLNPSAVGVVDRSGLLPLAYAISNEKIWLRLSKNSTYQNWCDRRILGHCIDDHTNAIKLLVNVFPDTLEWRNATDSFEWFMIAAAGNSSHLDTIYYLLRKNPIVLNTNTINFGCKKRKFNTVIE